MLIFHRSQCLFPIPVLTRNQTSRPLHYPKEPMNAKEESVTHSSISLFQDEQTRKAYNRESGRVKHWDM